MAKLTVYLPDDLAERVRDAGLSTSPLCQQALEAALTGPRVTMTRAGWCRVALDGAEAMVRFGLWDGDGLAVLEVALAGRLQEHPSVPLRALTDWANQTGAEALHEAIRERASHDDAWRDSVDNEERATASRRIGWGNAEDAVADLRLKAAAGA